MSKASLQEQLLASMKSIKTLAEAKVLVNGSPVVQHNIPVVATIGGVEWRLTPYFDNYGVFSSIIVEKMEVTKSACFNMTRDDVQQAEADAEFVRKMFPDENPLPSVA
jgi:hypothetical protein